jgi:hypothetical protein
MSEPTSDAAKATSGEFPAGPKPGPRNTTFFDDPVKDGLIRAVVTLGTELSVTRDRMRSLELLLRDSGIISAEAIDQLVLDSEEEQARVADRQRLIKDLIGPLAARLG